MQITKVIKELASDCANGLKDSGSEESAKSSEKTDALEVRFEFLFSVFFFISIIYLYAAK